MFGIIILAVAALTCQATPIIYSRPAAVYVKPITYAAPLIVNEAPKPYSFGYEAPAIGGGSSRSETSDGAGRVVGSYTVSDIDGRLRVVDYYADETGFHANVKTNEPGTANENSADVSVQSYAAPVVAPAVAPKVVAAAPVYSTVVAPKVVATAPVYSSIVSAPVARRVIAPAPLTYSVPAVSYATPLTYGLAPSLYRSSYYSPKVSYIYKK